MRRREFITLSGAAVISPLLAEAQQNPAPVIGILDPDLTYVFDAFILGMQDLGYVEGRNIVYVRKVSHGRPDSLRSLATDLVDLRVDAIVTAGTGPVRAAAAATASIPIIFVALGDPVSGGVVASLSHPEGNITGQSFLNDDLSAKRLDLLRELLPNLRKVAVFYGPGTATPTSLLATERAAQAFGLQLRPAQLPSVDSFEPAFQEANVAHVDAVDVLGVPFFNANRELLGRLSAKYRLAAIYESADYVRSGCLMGYGPVFTDMARRGAAYVDRILKGSKPGDLPVEVTSRFELSINLKAADALGITVPTTLLAQSTVLVE